MLQAYDVVKDDVAVIRSRLASPGDHRRDTMQRDAMQRIEMWRNVTRWYLRLKTDASVIFFHN